MVAFVKRGNHIVAAANNEKSSPKFLRFYAKGCTTRAYTGHAEMILCDKLKGDIKGKTVYVARFLRDGTPTMARPCKHCQRHLFEHGVRRVRYTDWNGKWKKMKIVGVPY